MQNKMREALEAERAEAAIRLHTTVEQVCVSLTVSAL